MTNTSDPGDSEAPTGPIALPTNQPPTFYRGAGRIAAFRSGVRNGQERLSQDRDGLPEDWVASTVPQFGRATAGLTILADGRSLCDAVRADPAFWVGAPSRGRDPALQIPLVKLLDAGQRLPVHVHPDDRFAREQLSVAQGKTEAWNIISSEDGATVHLGWARDVDRAQLAQWVAQQDIPAMMAAMHQFSVAAGDTIYVPAGTPHAIGEGIFLVEVQQSADASILLEWDGFTSGHPADSYCGLELPAALGAVTLTATSRELAQSWIGRGALLRPGTRAAILPPPAGAFFTAEVARGGATLAAGYHTVIVLDGTGSFAMGSGEHPVRAGATLAVPAGLGEVSVRGDVRLLAFGPAAEAR